VNQNNVLPEVDKTSQETQNDDGCDANGNNIYRNTVRKHYKPEDNKNIPDTGDPKQTESRNRQLTEEEMVRLESFSRLDPVTSESSVFDAATWFLEALRLNKRYKINSR
jgi:hypothetical protein